MYLYGTSVVFQQGVHLAQLNISRIVPLHRVGPFQRLDGLLILLEVEEAEAFVVPYLPVARGYPLGLVVHVDRGLVPPQEVQGTADLLEVADVARVNARCGLEELEGLFYLASPPLDQRLDVQRVLVHASRGVEGLLERREASIKVTPHVERVQ
eukprot:scaffold119607_cov39-Tisochrysis_lutea.AAC.1